MSVDRGLVLITGGAGLVGSRLASRFLQDGRSVRALDRSPFELAGVECVVGDVADPGDVGRAAEGAAMVAHCAAVIAGTVEDMTRVNVEGTRVVLEAALRAGCERFLLISSGVVYALEDRTIVDESTPILAAGPPFHMTKVHAEEAAWAASARGLPTTVFRPYAILGTHPTSTSSVLLAHQIARGEFVMRGDGSGSWPYVHIDSLVEAVVTAAQIARAVGQAYNMVDGQMTGKAYLDRLCQLLGVDPLTPRGEIVPWRGHYSGAKAERDLGYRPRVSYEEAMAEIERYLAQVGLLKKPGGGP